jgi:hypothetical protein
MALKVSKWGTPVGLRFAVAQTSITSIGLQVQLKILQVLEIGGKLRDGEATRYGGMCSEST